MRGESGPGLLRTALALIAVAGSVRVACAAPAAAERLRAVDPTALTDTYAPGAFAPEYTPPPPGTYTLPVIARVEDHPVLDADGTATTLFTAAGERSAVVAFVYTSCAEATGCPASHALLHRLDRMLAKDPGLAERVTLLTVSFDPERDTPARMAEQRKLHDPRTRWRFLTTRGGAELDGLLADFDQSIAKLRFEDGVWTGLYRHVLKVFLLDAARRVRAVYSAGFLDPALVVNDLKTLAAAPPS